METVLSVSVERTGHMQNLDDLAHAIDAASDAGDEAGLRELGKFG